VTLSSGQHTALKGRFPFRLGTTSYILPADIAPNVRHLAPLVDDVELVIFESEDVSALPDEKTIGLLKDLGDRHMLSYTVHLPLDARLGDMNEAARARSVDKCLRVIERTRPLEPLVYVVHPEREMQGGGILSRSAHWAASLSRSIDNLIREGVEAQSLCVETLEYPFELVEHIVTASKASICLDVGHLLRNAYSVEAYLERYLPLCRVIHLHGVKGGKDHCDVSVIDPDVLSLVLSRAGAPMTAGQRVVTLEVFNEADFEKSMRVMKGFLA
jgi:sugar phosphate isomerase/epimerase